MWQNDLESEAGWALDAAQRLAINFFLEKSDLESGLIADRSDNAKISSIAATGFGLCAYLVASKHGQIERREAVSRVLKALRFLNQAPQDGGPNSSGYQGFFYHFLDLRDGTRVMDSEVSIIDSALLLASILICLLYFDGADSLENEIRTLAKAIYERVNWRWAVEKKRNTLSHGWKPEFGFLNYNWEGYTEAIIAYVMALASPSYPILYKNFESWTSTYQWENIYGLQLLYAGPLFVHQFSHLWIDFRGIQDKFMRSKGFDYFKNSMAATKLQIEYAKRNPLGFKGYGEKAWGLSACNGPQSGFFIYQGNRYRSYGYASRSAPYGPDDGTLSPSCALCSVVFSPEIVLPLLISHFNSENQVSGDYGPLRSYNLSFQFNENEGKHWQSPYYLGIELGPLIMTIENFRNGFFWELCKRSEVLAHGLQKAGFKGGWLDKSI